eukprot:4939678-Amphidinium_carterae.1
MATPSLMRKWRLPEGRGRGSARVLYPRAGRVEIMVQNGRCKQTLYSDGAQVWPAAVKRSNLYGVHCEPVSFERNQFVRKVRKTKTGGDSPWMPLCLNC